MISLVICLWLQNVMMFFVITTSFNDNIFQDGGYFGRRNILLI